jgi:uncharacterized protein YcnI
MLVAALVVASAALHAHVTVSPRQSQPGATERYTVRVPTEGRVATTSVELEIPDGVTVTEVVAGEGYSFETRKTGDRIVAITWKKEIPPGGRADFVFVGRNPAAGPLVWKARQHFADRTTTDWAGAQGDRTPAAVTTVVTDR